MRFLQDVMLGLAGIFHCLDPEKWAKISKNVPKMFSPIFDA